MKSIKSWVPGRNWPPPPPPPRSPLGLKRIRHLLLLLLLLPQLSFHQGVQALPCTQAPLFRLHWREGRKPESGASIYGIHFATSWENSYALVGLQQKLVCACRSSTITR